jgi:hypothetical protein
VCFLVDGDCECDSCEIVIVICVVDEMKKKKRNRKLTREHTLVSSGNSTGTSTVTLVSGEVPGKNVLPISTG